MALSLEQRLIALEDHKEIVELKAKYCNCVDGGWGTKSNDGSAVAALFVEDGVWDLSAQGVKAEGRHAIRDAVDRFSAVPFIIHNVMNPVITVLGDSATGQWHAIFCMNEAENHSAFSLSFAIYDERYVRTAEGWRFSVMKITPAGTVPVASRR